MKFPFLFFCLIFFSQKKSSKKDQGETDSYRRKPNKIIIREVEQPSLKSILKSQLDTNGNNNDLTFERLIIDEPKNVAKKNEEKNASSSSSASSAADLKSNSYSNLKIGYAKDGSLRYTYE